MAHDVAPPVEITEADVLLGDRWPKFLTSALSLGGVILIVLAVLLGFVVSYTYQTRYDAAFFSYLLNFLYVLSLALGALILVILMHLVHAGWGVVVRRVAEIISLNVINLIPVFIPILLVLWIGYNSGDGAIFRWASTEELAHNPVVAGKTAYLNPTFFTIRAILYFVIWAGLAWFYYSRSRQQDHLKAQAGDTTKARAERTRVLQKWAAPSVILFGVALTFAAVDWIMSLQPTWFSTIFGVYFFAGCMVSSISLVIVILFFLQRAGLLRRIVTIEHYHDLGKLLFGFVFFWSYIAFSQYLLIWYANIPEETEFYLERQSHGWAAFGLALVFGHILIPFLGLMGKRTRRSPAVLTGWAIYLLVIHWIDMFWLVAPVRSPDAPYPTLIDLMMLAGMVMIFAAPLLARLGRTPLIPTGDPRLEESLAFRQMM